MGEWNKTDIIPEVNSSWKQMCLGDLGEFKNGVNFNREAFGKGIPVINVKQLYNNRYASLSRLEEIKIETIRNINDYRLETGDILFARSSVKLEGTGQVAMVKELPIQGATFSGFIIRFRCKNSKVDRRLLRILIKIELL